MKMPETEINLRHTLTQTTQVTKKGILYYWSCLYLVGGLVDWRWQTVVAISTVEAEYVAMSKACLMILHFRNLLGSINEKQNQATVVFEDNSGAVSF